MRRTTVMIPEDLKIRAARRANSVGLSLGGFICWRRCENVIKSLV